MSFFYRFFLYYVEQATIYILMCTVAYADGEVILRFIRNSFDGIRTDILLEKRESI
jgi:hypothetical protein